MPKKTHATTKHFVCEKCGPVSFFVHETEHTADEGMILATTVDQILNYGSCQVAKNAKIPGHPVHDELTICPVYTQPYFR